MIDMYSKAVLTVIAVALSVIAYNLMDQRTAVALGEACGEMRTPCYITTNERDPLFVRIKKY